MDINLNIIEVYLKKYGQMIILLLGMPTSNKSSIAKELELDIEPKFTLININDYLEKKIINIEVKNIKYKLYDHPDNIDYTRLLNDINQKKSSGIILYGNFIDTNKIEDIKIDFSYFFDIRHAFLKKNLIKKKILPFDDEIENISNIYLNNYKKIEKPLITEKSLITDKSSTISNSSDNTTTTEDNTTKKDNTITVDNTTTNNNLKNIYERKINRKLEIYISYILLPIYDNIKKNIKFNKYFNIKEDTDFDTVYDNLFEQFIYLIKKNLNQPLDEDENSSEKNIVKDKKIFFQDK